MDENRAVTQQILPPEPISLAEQNAPAAKSDAKPYRLLGLFVSLAAIAVLAIVYGAFIGTWIYIFVFGWNHLVEVVKQLFSSVATGEDTFLPLVLRDFSNSLVVSLTLSLIIYLAAGLAVVSLARFRGGPAWRTLIAWRPWTPWAAGRLYWFIVIGALIYSFISNALIASYYPPSKDWFTVPHDNRVSALLLFLVAAVFAPVAEELLFRGWIYTSLRAQFGFWISLVVSSAIFAGLHYEETHIYALAVFPIGLALGVMRETSGSLKASISFHAFFNAVAFGLAAFDFG